MSEPMRRDADTARVCPGSRNVGTKRRDDLIRCPYCKRLFQRLWVGRNTVPSHTALIGGSDA